MAVIKVIRNTYGGVEYIRKACEYILHSPFIKNYSAFGVCAFDPKRAAEQMVDVRKFFHKESGNPLFHVIIAFDDEMKNEKAAWNYIVNSALWFLPDYQIFFGMHGKDEECPHLHGHLVINSVSYKTGKMLNSGVVMQQFKIAAEKLFKCKCTLIFLDKKDS